MTGKSAVAGFSTHNVFDLLDRSYLKLYPRGEFLVTMIHPLEPSNGAQWRTVARRCLRWIIIALRGRTGEANAPKANVHAVGAV